MNRFCALKSTFELPPVLRPDHTEYIIETENYCQVLSLELTPDPRISFTALCMISSWTASLCSLPSEVLKWVPANGCEMTEMTCAAAATGEHLEVLKWLRANGCHWSALTCAQPALGGHLDMLKSFSQAALKLKVKISFS